MPSFSQNFGVSRTGCQLRIDCLGNVIQRSCYLSHEKGRINPQVIFYVQVRYEFNNFLDLFNAEFEMIRSDSLAKKIIGIYFIQWWFSVNLLQTQAFDLSFPSKQDLIAKMPCKCKRNGFVVFVVFDFSSISFILNKRMVCVFWSIAICRHGVITLPYQIWGAGFG